MTRILRPTTFQEAAFLLREEGPGARLLAGGTDALLRVRRGQPEPSAWVDLSGVQEGREIRPGHLGALVTFADLAEKAPFHALRMAASGMGSAQIRRRGTLGGNVVNASPAGDAIPPLFVVDARVRLLSASGEREVGLRDFFVGPGRTVAGPDEVLTCITWEHSDAAQSAFVRVGNRVHHVISKASLALWVNPCDDTWCEVRIALGAVAPTVIRVPDAERLLSGSTPDATRLESAALACAAAARPIDDIRSTAEYRREVCAALLQSAVGLLASFT